jgi:hypothetical protein
MALITLSNEQWWVTVDACRTFVPAAETQAAIIEAVLPPRGTDPTVAREISLSVPDVEACTTCTQWAPIFVARHIGSVITQQVQAGA